MGNNPSNQKGEGGSSGPHAHTTSSPPQREQKKDKDGKPLIPLHSSGVAAPPEASLAQAELTFKNNIPGGSVAQHHFASYRTPIPSPSTTTSPPPSQTHSPTVARPIDVRPKPGTHVQQQEQLPRSHLDGAKPVAVPHSVGSHPPATRAIVESPGLSGPTSPVSPYDALESAGLHALGSMTDVLKPPRLPLPIDEEIHTPGSPIIAPTDGEEPVEDVDELDDNGISRKASTLSNTTADDEELEELRVDKTRPTVPTRLEWLRGGDKVYVTGTIFQWNRKQRLHRVEGQPGAFATTINILPGTHHIRFLVDNNMQTSPDLPTTVDFGNNLVNYIEVSPDEAVSPTQAVSPGDKLPVREGKSPSGLAAAAAAAAAAASASASAAPVPADQKAKQPRYRPMAPKEKLTNVMPEYLGDYDAPEGSERYENSMSAIDMLPNPPSAPGFLLKPILNTATLMKDDNSVLNMPNHTTLNHLATASIRDDILAVTATTRYKDKYVTTIIYKPATTAGH